MPLFPAQPHSTTMPAFEGAAVSPSDTEDLTTNSRGIYVGVSGDLKVTLVTGTTLTFVGIAAGIVHPLQVKKVFDTLTTATNILALW